MTRPCARPGCPKSVTYQPVKRGRPKEFCSIGCQRSVKNAAARAKRRRPDGVLWSEVPLQHPALEIAAVDTVKLDRLLRHTGVARQADLYLTIERNFAPSALNRATRMIVSAPSLNEQERGELDEFIPFVRHHDDSRPGKPTPDEGYAVGERPDAYSRRGSEIRWNAGRWRTRTSGAAHASADSG